MHQDPTDHSDEVALNWCQDLPPVPVLTTVAPVGVEETFYLATYGQLYAVNASDGTVRWCQQLTLTREYSYQPGVSYPPPSQMLFGTPRVTNGVVYVCASGHGRYTYAFNAGDGTLRWRMPTDAWRVSMPFGDFAVPIVKDGIVYNGTYALDEQDGTVLRRIAIDTRWFSPQALVQDTMYSMSQKGVYALNANNGTEYWHSHYPHQIIPLATAR